MKIIMRHIRAAILLTVLLTILTGLLYPLAVTGLAHLVFPEKANGSMIKRQNRTIGSELIGQQFSSPKYFWSRLSATSPSAYNAAASSGSNYGPLHPALYDAVKKKIHELRSLDTLNIRPVPMDLVTTSASGLDPHISIAAALFQVTRVARARGISEQEIQSLIDEYTEKRTFHILGEPRVHVLKLNCALDEFQRLPKKDE